MNQETRKILISSALLALLIFTSIVTSSEVTQTPFTNHKNDVEMNLSTLKLEARSEENDLIESSTIIKPSNETQIFQGLSKTRSNVRKIKSPMQDSYLDALKYSHLSNGPREDTVKSDIKSKPSKIIRRTYDGPVYRPHTDYGPPKESTSSYGPPNGASEPANIPRIVYGASDAPGPTQESFRPTPSNSYSLPNQISSSFNDQNPYRGGNQYGAPPQVNYGTPSASYGIPNANYGPVSVPQKTYGPPRNSYLPATQPQQGEARAYGPPSQWSGFALPDLPQLPSLPSFDFSFPLALKLNAFTIAKIILKLVMFKMIVKFIAVLCLILFIPKLEIKKDENDDAEDGDESRKLITPYFTNERLNNLTSLVLNSIEMYERANGVISNNEKKCTTVSCRMRDFLRSGETWNDYLKLFNNYIDDEKNVISSLEKKSPTKIT